MSMNERESLIGRIRQIRRTAQADPGPAGSGGVDPRQDELQALDARMTHLEQQLQGLQDSVHREALRQGKRLTDLEARIEPGALNQALTKDARERGL
jgi:hypothetical protein